MAGVIGGEAGYATVSPTRNYIGEAMANVQDSMYKQNAQRMANEKALQEQEQAVREAQGRKDKEAIEYAEKHKLTKTGIKSVDSKNYEIALKLQQLNVEGVEELSQARTIEEKTAAMSKIQKASIGFDTINKFNNDYTATKADLLKNQKDYDPNYLQDIAEEGKKFDNGQYEYSLDDDYNVRFNTHDIDPATGKVSAVTAQNLSGDEMAAKFKGLPKSNYAGEGDGVSFLDNFSKRIKEKKEETNSNGKIITSYPAALADAEAASKAAVSDPSLRYNVHTQMAKELNVPKSEITDEQIYQKILNDTKSLIPKDKEETDYQAANYNLSVKREANDERQRAITNARESRKEAKEKKAVRFTVKNGILGEETSATMSMTEKEYDDYLAKNGVKDVKTLDEIWNNPINAGYVKVAKNSPAKSKAPQKQAVEPKKQDLRSKYNY